MDNCLWSSALALLLSGCMVGGAPSRFEEAQQAFPPNGDFDDPSGKLTTISTAGAIDVSTANPFFQSLGANGRSCGSCHLPSDGWGLSAAHAQQIFDATQGLDPLFRPVDGAVAPTADVSTLIARQTAYALLRTKGLIRVSVPIPATAEFAVIAVDDPYHAASATQVNMYRRPPPAANLRFLTTVMWDGRESKFGETLDDHLMHQALDATLGHAEAATTPAQTALRGIVDFEEALYAAQSTDADAGVLTAKQANGGPLALSTQAFHLGINDPFGGDPAKVPFTSQSMTIYSSWSGAPGNGATSTDNARASVARGETLFNTRTITVSGVAGVNDALGVASVAATCTTCHDSPNVGDHSLPLPLDLGLTDAARRTPDLPLYTLQNLTTGAQRQTTDPGRAMVTGLWKDIAKFKGPILRGLPSRAPYFHNGFAATLDDVVAFYDARFGMQLTPQEHADLVAFLKTL
jgi:hypothetical protein